MTGGEPYALDGSRWRQRPFQVVYCVPYERNGRDGRHTRSFATTNQARARVAEMRRDHPDWNVIGLSGPDGEIPLDKPALSRPRLDPTDDDR